MPLSATKAHFASVVSGFTHQGIAASEEQSLLNLRGVVLHDVNDQLHIARLADLSAITKL